MITGLLLAAGAGVRAGGPKALRSDPDGTSWLRRSVQVLTDGGCDDVLVVLGAAADRAVSILPDVGIVIAEHWQQGISASLRAGLEAARATYSTAVLVHLVDLPDVTAAVVERVLQRADGIDPPAAVLLRATYCGRPGHPVLIGRGHWNPLLATLQGDRGANEYLISRQVTPVECGDLANGLDQDS